MKMYRQDYCDQNYSKILYFQTTNDNKTIMQTIMQTHDFKGDFTVITVKLVIMCQEIRSVSNQAARYTNCVCLEAVFKMYI